MMKWGIVYDRVCIGLGVLCGIATLYYTYLAAPSHPSQPASLSPVENLWPVIILVVLSICWFGVGITRWAIMRRSATENSDEASDALSAVDVDLRAKMYTGDFRKPDDNLTKFLLQITAKSELIQPRVYLEIEEMRSGWSGQDPFWTKVYERALIDEWPILHAGESRSLELGQRDGFPSAPLNIQGHHILRDNTVWPYTRLTITVNASAVLVRKVFVILAPGYVHSSVLTEDQVPMTHEAIGRLRKAEIKA